VAAHLGTDHTDLYVTPEETRAVIPELPTIYDEPFADSSQIPTYLVARLARESVTVSLSGDGGDELFGGYNRYFLGSRIWDRVRWVPRPVRRTVARALRTSPPAAWDWLGEALHRMVPGGYRSHQLADRIGKLAAVLASDHPDSIYWRLVSSWSDPGSVVRGGAEPPGLANDRTRWPALDSFPQQMMFVDSVTYLPDDILVKVDRAAMAVSLETRVPFLDHRVVEFAWRLPVEMKVKGGRGKRVLRRVLDRYVPRRLIERPKMGFGVPVGIWLRGPLREWAEALIDERRLQGEGFLDPRPVHALWRRHLAGEMNTESPIWGVLMFQAWLEHARAAAPRARHLLRPAPASA
jgi:asparagine synthase (glutamine-hydrolysing)